MAKDKKFVGKLKGFFKGVLNVIPYTMALTTSLVLAGLHPIKTAKAVKEYIKIKGVRASSKDCCEAIKSM